MARPRSFDETLALQRAKEVFWERGYEGTSIRDLSDALRLGRGSLYGAFGDKEQLFHLALRDYVEEDQRALFGPLHEDGPSFVAIQAVFDQILASLDAVPGRGCFLTNSTTECAGRDAVVTSQASAAFSVMRRAFEAALARGVIRGEVRDGVDVSGAAAMLAALVNGVQVMGKAEGASPAVRGAVASALQSLEPSP